MNAPTEYLSPAEAARRLGVSVKALRIYEQHGLIAPRRSAAGWRAYGPDELRRAGEIAALRALGFGLAQIARVLEGEGLAPALAAQQARLEAEQRRLSATLETLQRLRDGLADGAAPAEGALPGLPAARQEPLVAFDLPWPWGGERFELRALRPLTYITGPLFSGKTRLARRLAETLPGAAFLGLERLADGAAEARAKLDADPALAARVERRLAWLLEAGAARSDALLALLAGLEAEGPAALVVDMVEQDLDAATQRALTGFLRGRGPDSRPLLLLTRSCEILDLPSLGPDEAVLLCPANHGPPSSVEPIPGAPGYEAVATCLAAPEVRARTQGVIAWRPPAA